MTDRLHLVRLLVFALSLSAHPAAAQVKTGHYVGQGGYGVGITSVGFQPDILLIKGDSDVGVAFVTRAMPAGSSKSISGSAALEPEVVLSLESNGFTLGTAWRVNRTGIDYWYAAFQSVPGLIAQGSFVGDGTDDRAITGVGFQPDFVLVASEGAHSSFWRTSSMPDGFSSFVSAAALVTDRVQRLLPDGFEVGQNAAVNASGATHYYVAFRADPAWMATGSFQGDGQDARSISGVGFRPELVLLKVDLPLDNILRPASLEGDFSLPLAPTWKASNLIEALEPDGFRVGSAPEVNAADAGVYWFAWRTKAGAGVVADVTPETATIDAGDALTLDATASTGAIAQWQWSLIEGPTGVRFSNAATQTISFSEPGRYRIRLVVTDATGAESAPVHSEILVRGATRMPDAKLSACSSAGAVSAPLALLLLAALSRRRDSSTRASGADA